MIELLVCVALLSQAAAGDAPPEHVQKYLQRCEEAKTAAIAAKEAELKRLEDVRTAEAEKKRQAAAAELKRLKEQPPPLVRMRMPPAAGEVGLVGSDDAGEAGRVTVLEVVDEDDAMIRAWYRAADQAADEAPTFVDLWLHGIDTKSLTARMPANLPQVFHVTGSELFDTTCGKRSLPRLEPIDVERYRSPPRDGGRAERGTLDRGGK